MANYFKSFTDTSIGTTAATIYTVPASSVAVIIGCNLANLTGDQVNASVIVEKVSQDNVYIVRNIPIPNGSAFEFNAGNKIVLETGDLIKVISDTASSIDAIVSILEQGP